ncbi:MAG: nuclear transport factor 2 family protein [Acidimicrobiales bacterium]
MSEATKANLALVERWADTFNNDVEQMVRGLYAPDARLGGAVLGHDKLLKFEQRVLAAAPKRTMRIERTHVSGDDVVVVEATLFDPDQGEEWKLPFCVVLTFAGGKIVRDDTYTDFSRWPGMH